MNKVLKRKTITSLLLTASGAVTTLAAEEQQDTAQREPDNIVVTATRTGIEARNAPSGYSQVDRDDIEWRMATTLAEMIQDVPGIALDNEMDGRSQVRIRGFEPSQTLILLNGRRINNTDELQGHSDFRMSQIPTAAIDRVEIVKGPTSSLYGADALGGVVNAILRPPSDTWTGRTQFRGGLINDPDSAGEQGLSLYAAGPAGDRIGAIVSLDLVDREGVLSPDEPGVDDLEGRESINGYASVFYQPGPGHEFELFLTGSDDERRARRGSSATREVDLLRYSTGIRYDFEAEHWQARADIYRSRGETESIHLLKEEQHTDDIVDLSASREWAVGQTLTLGADYRREHFWRQTAGIVEHDDVVEHRGALAQNRSSLLDDRLIVTLGTRFDDHTRYSGEISPRAGIVYALTDNTRVKADYGRGFSAPDLRRSAQDYDFTFTTLPLRLLGNPDLEPERSESVSFSLEHENDGVSAAITLFHNDITDLIDLRCIEHCPPGSPPAGENEIRIYTNVDSAITQGVELAYSQQLGNSTRLDVNYTYLDTENRQTGNALEKRPRERLNLSLVTTPWQDGSLNLRSEYTGKQLRGTEWARDYTLFHLGFRQQLTPQLQLQSGINNLTDQRLGDIDANFNNEIRGRYYYMALNWEF